MTGAKERQLPADEKSVFSTPLTARLRPRRQTIGKIPGMHRRAAALRLSSAGGGVYVAGARSARKTCPWAGFQRRAGRKAPGWQYPPLRTTPKPRDTSGGQKETAEKQALFSGFSYPAHSLMLRKPLPMISEEVVIVMKDCGSVARTNSCSRMAWERLTTAMTIL